jgi:hypothetical protein
MNLLMREIKNKFFLEQLLLFSILFENAIK